MNKVLVTGRFKKIWHEEGKSFRFNVSVRRTYKNKDGKYDWDNVTLNCPAFNKATINFLQNYVNNGDIVDVEGHVNTYVTENENGEKSYHQDLVCDQITIAAKASEKGDDVVSEEKITADSGCPDGFEEADIDDEDCPF